MGLMTEAEFDTPLDFNGPGTVGCLGLWHRRGHRLRRSDEHRRRAVQHHALLRA